MNSTNPQVNSMKGSNLNCLKTKKNKFSISIYSNPLNLQVPFLNKPKGSGVSSIYKITSDKIQNLKPHQKKHDHKLTITNIMKILHTTTSFVHTKPTQSYLTNNPFNKSKQKPTLPAKINLPPQKKKNLSFHSKNYSISLAKRNSMKSKKIIDNFFADVERKMSLLKRSSKSPNYTSNQNIKKKTSKKKVQNSFSIPKNTNNTITSRKPEENKIIHERATSCSFRDPNLQEKKFRYRSVSHKKESSKKSQNEKQNKMKNVKKKSIIPYRGKGIKKGLTLNKEKEKLPIKSSLRQRRPDSSSSKLKTTEGTPHNTLQKDCETQNTNTKATLCADNSLFYLSEDETEEDPFNDINTIVKKVDFNEEEKLEIFDEKNRMYSQYRKVFDDKFEKIFGRDFKN